MSYYIYRHTLYVYIYIYVYMVYHIIYIYIIISMLYHPQSISPRLKVRKGMLYGITFPWRRAVDEWVVTEG